jgi:hypothetical protein
MLACLYNKICLCKTIKSAGNHFLENVALSKSKRALKLMLPAGRMPRDKKEGAS